MATQNSPTVHLFGLKTLTANSGMKTNNMQKFGIDYVKIVAVVHDHTYIHTYHHHQYYNSLSVILYVCMYVHLYIFGSIRKKPAKSSVFSREITLMRKLPEFLTKDVSISEIGWARASLSSKVWALTSQITGHSLPAGEAGSRASVT